MQSHRCGPPVRLGLGCVLTLSLVGAVRAQQATTPSLPLLSTLNATVAVALPGEVEPPPPEQPVPPGSLKGATIPPVVDLVSGDALSPSTIVDEQAAIALGKALFWDMQAGSDGQACASCHFHAGADNRFVNQLSPGLNGGNGNFDPIRSSGKSGPNLRLGKQDWPFHRLADTSDRDSEVLFDTDDVSSSQGVFPTTFNAVIPGSVEEDCDVLGAGAGGDPVGFEVGGTNVRRVEPRNTPTVINAVFNHRNFWDGRANNIFNGVDPFGRRNEAARVLEVQPDGSLERIRVEFENSSLASQAVGPLLSDFEMSCSGRTFPDAARKLLSLQPLALQRVASDDSVLGSVSLDPAPGISGSYSDMIRAAFHPRFWDSNELVDGAGEKIDLAALDDEEEEEEKDGFTVMEANFALFWGLAIQAYETTLVSDDSPFDRWRDGELEGLGEEAELGWEVFLGDGKCVNCHATAMFTKASTLHLLDEAAEEGLVERMLTFEQVHPYTVRGQFEAPAGTGVLAFDVDAEGAAKALGQENAGLGRVRMVWTKDEGLSTEFSSSAEYEVIGFALEVDGDPSTRDAGLVGVLSESSHGSASMIVLYLVDGLDGPDQVLLQAHGRTFCASEAVSGGDLRIQQPALYDNGFYNIGVRVNAEDIGLGGEDQWGNPLSFSRQYLEMLQGKDVPDPFQVDPCSFEIPFDEQVDTVFFPGGFTGDGCGIEPANVPANQESIRRARTAADGAFKTSTLRNVELTGPFFHNGGQRTLRQVVRFYNRGGDFAKQNRDELAPDIRPLGLSGDEQEALVAFMKTLTDERVAQERAPFDHPQLFVPNGHPGDHLFVVDSNGDGQADATYLEDSSVFLEIPAVGAGGRPDAGLPALKPFLQGVPEPGDD